MLGIVAVWTVSYFFTNLLICFPVTALIEPFYGNNCINGVPMWHSNIITDLVVDVGILLMPVPMVLRLQLPWKERTCLLGIFLLGATVCAISLTRLITLLEVAKEYIQHGNDVTYYTSPAFYWTNIEMAMAVVSACLPTLRPIWVHLSSPSPQPSGQPSGSGSCEEDGQAVLHGPLWASNKEART